MTRAEPAHAQVGRENCPFCAIVAREAPADIVREWDDAIAIVPLNPVTEGHTLILPKVHVQTFFSSPDVAAATMRRVSEMLYGVEVVREPFAYNVITSAGQWATQTVPHLHVHLVPRRPHDGLLLPWTAQTCRHGNTARGRIEHALFYAMRDEFEDECIDEYCATYASAVLDALGMAEPVPLRPEGTPPEG